MGSQGWLRTGGTPLPRPLSEKAKAQESEGLCEARELESCGAPDPLTVAEGRGREKDWRPTEGAGGCRPGLLGPHEAAHPAHLLQELPHHARGVSGA